MSLPRRRPLTPASMRQLILCATFALALAAICGSALNADPVKWDALVDAEAQNFDDPYAALTPEQLNDLVTLVRLRARVEWRRSGCPGHCPGSRSGWPSWRLHLAVVGVDVDWLIEQRWVVAERRRAAALAGNQGAGWSQRWKSSGFLIPAPPDDDGVPTAYLVPERGMCSHMPPPPPNQLLQLRLPDVPGHPAALSPGHCPRNYYIWRRRRRDRLCGGWAGFNVERLDTGCCMKWNSSVGSAGVIVAPCAVPVILLDRRY